MFCLTLTDDVCKPLHTVAAAHSLGEEPALEMLFADLFNAGSNFVLRTVGFKSRERIRRAQGNPVELMDAYPVKFRKTPQTNAGWKESHDTNWAVSHKIGRAHV